MGNKIQFPHPLYIYIDCPLLLSSINWTLDQRVSNVRTRLTRRRMILLLQLFISPNRRAYIFRVFLYTGTRIHDNNSIAELIKKTIVVDPSLNEFSCRSLPDRTAW
jgi:hypothetical protein